MLSVSVNVERPGTFDGLFKQFEFSDLAGGLVSGTEGFSGTPLVDELIFGWTGVLLCRLDSFANLDFAMSPLGRPVAFCLDFDGIESIERNRIVGGGSKLG